jgi:hypothetical protein
MRVVAFWEVEEYTKEERLSRHKAETRLVRITARFE